MSYRASESEVRSILDTTATITNMARFIRTANALTNYVVSKDSLNMLDDGLSKELEIYLAAHFYALKDPQLQTKSTGKAGGTFQGQTGMGLDLTWWGQQAKLLDITGLLAQLSSTPRKTVQILWAGTAVVDQLVDETMGW